MSVNLRGKTAAATVTDRTLSVKGLFYLTRDDAGVERKVRSADVSAAPASHRPAKPEAACTAMRPRARAEAAEPERAEWLAAPGHAKPDSRYGWPRGMREATAAEYVGLSVSGLRSVVKAGKLKSVQLTPGRIVYLREDLDSFLDRAAGKNVAPSQDEWLTGMR